MKNKIFHTPFVPLPRQILRQFRLTPKPEQIRKGMVMEMKRKIGQRLFAVTTASILLLSCSGVVEAVAAEIELQKIADAKISDTLKAKMSQRSTDKIPVILWTSDLNMNEVQAEILAETTVSQAPATVRMMSQSEPEHDLEYLQEYGTDEEIQGYIEAKRAKAQEEYTEMNQKFIAEQLPAGAEVTFVSEYSPIIFAEMKASDVTKAARSSKVETVGTYEIVEGLNFDLMGISVPTIQADYVRDTYGSKGAGVKIGQLESGVPNKNLPQFNSSKIHILSGSITDHANRVASIMVAKNYGGYQGIVPEAELYCYGVGNTSEVKDIAQAIEELLKKGVNVINASRSLGTVYTKEYDAMSKWIDHISSSHDVHFVLAAGNKGENTIAGGGFAYNSIVVGASNSNGNTSITNDEHQSTSSYSTNTSLPNKPDISAPGDNIKVAGYTADSGTSFAAPHVTGTIAQLCCFIPALKTQQTSVKALLIAGVNNTADGSGNRKMFKGVSDTNYQKWGAGIVDARGTRWVASQSRYSRSTFYPSDANGTTKTYTFKATSSDNFIRVALCFMKKNIPNNNHTGIEKVASEANVDLTVTGPNGFSQSSSSLHNNTEIVDIPNPVAGGTYTVKVKLTTKSNENVPFGIAWR